MIQHLVVFRFRDDVEEDARERLLEEMRTFPNVFTAMRNFHLGRNESTRATTGSPTASPCSSTRPSFSTPTSRANDMSRSSCNGSGRSSPSAPSSRSTSAPTLPSAETRPRGSVSRTGARATGWAP